MVNAIAEAFFNMGALSAVVPLQASAPDPRQGTRNREGARAAVDKDSIAVRRRAYDPLLADDAQAADPLAGARPLDVRSKLHMRASGIEARRVAPRPHGVILAMLAGGDTARPGRDQRQNTGASPCAALRGAEVPRPPATAGFAAALRYSGWREACSR